MTDAPVASSARRSSAEGSTIRLFKSPLEVLVSSLDNHDGWPEPDRAMCIRCDEAPAVDDNGYCGHCHWAVRAEVEKGLYQLRERLRQEVRFQEWLARHPEAA